MRTILRKIKNTARFLPWLVLAKLGRRRNGSLPDSLQGRRVLLVQWNAIGDALMTTPLLSAIKTHHPLVKIEVLATRTNRYVFDCEPDVDQVHALEPANVWHVLLKTRSLRRKTYDLILDPSANLRAACTTRWLSATASVGFSRKLEAGFIDVDISQLYDHTTPYSTEHNIPSLIMTLGERWAGSIQQKRMIFKVPNEGRQIAAKWFDEHAIDSRTSVILHPGAKWIPKRWPETHWIQLSRALLHRSPPWTPILVGSKDDGPMIRRIAKEAGSGVETLIDYDIPTLGAIVERSRVAICNDSFVMHLVSALDKPLVALLGPVNPSRVVPEGSPVEILHKGLFCSPCDLYYSARRCWRGLNFCLLEIGPEEAIAAMDRLLERNSSQSAAG